MKELQEIFKIESGLNLELNKLKEVKDGINFVSRTSKNNGVSAQVERLIDVPPIKSGVITVSAGGSVLEAFLQPKSFYTGWHIYYLDPKITLSDNEKLFYCMVIRANKYKYSYGRQANRTLKNILVPDPNKIPEWVNSFNLTKFDKIVLSKKQEQISLADKPWNWFKYSDLFIIERGRGPRKKDLNGEGNTPFITSSDSNNGLTNFTEMPPIHSGNTIGVNRNGSVAEAFYQPVPFCSTEDVHIFIPKFELNQYIAMFLNTLIKKEKYRYSYGRKWGIERMKNSSIKLPVDDEGKPDWFFMERYIKTLPFSSAI